MKTKEKIKLAFAELIRKNKFINKININKLCERAKISRSTFYVHYTDIYDVVEEIQNDFIKQLNNHLNFKNISEIPNNFIFFFNFLEDNIDFFRKLLHSDESTYFISKISKMLKVKLFNCFYNEVLITQNKFIKLECEIFIEGLIIQIQKYLKNQSEYSKENLIEFVQKWCKK